MGLTKKIDHVAIVVKDVDAAVGTFSRHFGFPVESGGAAAEPGTRRARLRIGDATLDLLGPAGATSPAAQFLADRGEGMYQLVLEVDDVAAAADQLRARGIACDSQQLASGAKLGILDPSKTHGVPLALIEHPKRGA
jgi:methylmalonyl-CoA/ethylmalonyl-CoA epimerase